MLELSDSESSNYLSKTTSTCTDSLRGYIRSIGRERTLAGRSVNRMRTFFRVLSTEVKDDPPIEIVSLVELLSTSHRSSSKIEFKTKLKWDLANNRWTGRCSCAKKKDCIHCIEVAEHTIHNISPLLASVYLLFAGEGTKIDELSGRDLVTRQISPAHVLKSKLGRSLTNDEVRFCRSIVNLFLKIQDSNYLTPANLHAIFPHKALDSHYGGQLEIWSKKPKSPWHLWLYCARHLRALQIAIPPTIGSVTNTNFVEGDYMKVTGKKLVSEWNSKLNYIVKERGKLKPTVIELRIYISLNSFKLYYRESDKEKFKLVTNQILEWMSDQRRRGALITSAGTEAMFAFMLNSFHIRNIHREYDLQLPTLHPIIAQHNPSGLICNSRGESLAIAPDPLKWQIQSPNQLSPNYQISLSRSDGTPAPVILCTVPGEPFYYITDSAIFAGPTLIKSFLSITETSSIPPAVMETPLCLSFLEASGAELPIEISKRVIRHTVKPTLQCELQPLQNSGKEQIIFSSMVKDGTTWWSFRNERWEVADQSKKPLSLEGTKTETEGEDTIIVNDLSLLESLPGLITSLTAKWDWYRRNWYASITKNFPAQFAEWFHSLPEGITINADPELASILGKPIVAHATLTSNPSPSGIDWFDLSYALDLGGAILSEEEIKLLLRAKGGFVRLPKRGWLRLEVELPENDRILLESIGIDVNSALSTKTKVHALQLMNFESGTLLDAKSMAEIKERVAKLRVSVKPKLPKVIKATLRDYQLDGFHFLAYLSSNKFGGILADDMGLGKTLQTLVWLAWLLENKKKAGEGKCSLVVCPKSVVDNWKNEAAKFFPSLRVSTVDSTNKEDLEQITDNSQLIIMNYTTFRMLGASLTSKQWLAVVLDEGQYIKNPSSIAAILARQLSSAHRLVLTGTPIENRLQDLWSLMAFAMPGYLGTRKTFSDFYEKGDCPEARYYLAERLRPFLLRRTKGEVAKDLPEKIEEDIFCQMTPKQSELYGAELKKAQQFLLGGAQSKKELSKLRFHVFSSLLRLRQICCSPELVGIEEKAHESSKVEALIELLETITSKNEKVLVFSQFRSMLEILKPRVSKLGSPLYYLDGSTEGRAELVESFNNEPGSAVFLISLKAGGVGMNLTGASYVVLFDPWWNPAVENQAIDRTHRIGQSKTVIAYRLIAKDSIEEKIKLLQYKKRELLSAINEDQDFNESLSLDELRSLILESAEANLGEQLAANS